MRLEIRGRPVLAAAQHRPVETPTLSVAREGAFLALARRALGLAGVALLLRARSLPQRGMLVVAAS